jgi:hypothetical protein
MGYNPPLIFGPIASENNPPIHPEWYKPRVYDIAAIVNGTTTLVTTTVDHDYVIGQEVRFLISQLYGERQLNEKTALVTAIPAPNQIVVGIDSTLFDLFVANLTSGTTQPQVAAIGDINTGQINDHGRCRQKTWIPGSFRDISPYEPPVA